MMRLILADGSEVSIYEYERFCIMLESNPLRVAAYAAARKLGLYELFPHFYQEEDVLAAVGLEVNDETLKLLANTVEVEGELVVPIHGNSD